MVQSFTYGAGLTPLSTQEGQYNALAAALMQQGLNPGITMGGIGGIGQGLGAIAQAFAGSRLQQKANQTRQASIDATMKQLDALNLPSTYKGIFSAMAQTNPMEALSGATQLSQQLKPKIEWQTGPGGIPTPFETGFDQSGNPYMRPYDVGGGGTIPAAAPQPQDAPAATATASAGQYEPMIQMAAQKYGVPADGLRAQLAQESINFRPDVVSGQRPSPAGAIGVGQFMPATAKQYGIDPTNPAQSIDAAARMMAELKQKYGNWPMALAAYNWGSGHLEKQGIMNAPEETRNYIAKLAPIYGGAGPTAAPQIAGLPEGLGPPPTPVDPSKFIIQNGPFAGQVNKIELERAQQKFQEDLSAWNAKFELAKNAQTQAQQERTFNLQQQGQTINHEDKLRDDFNGLPEVKAYKVVKPIIESAYETLGRDNHASDLNLVYAIGKIMDPNSVVREGEMVMVTQAGSPAQQIQGYLDYLSGGGKFTLATRQQLITELRSRADALQQQYDLQFDNYKDIAGQYPGIDANRVLGKRMALKIPGEGSQGGTATGNVEKWDFDSSGNLVRVTPGAGGTPAASTPEPAAPAVPLPNAPSVQASNAASPAVNRNIVPIQAQETGGGASLIPSAAAAEIGQQPMVPQIAQPTPMAPQIARPMPMQATPLQPQGGGPILPPYQAAPVLTPQQNGIVAPRTGAAQSIIPQARWNVAAGQGMPQIPLRSNIPEVKAPAVEQPDVNAPAEPGKLPTGFKVNLRDKSGRITEYTVSGRDPKTGDYVLKSKDGKTINWWPPGMPK